MTVELPVLFVHPCPSLHTEHNLVSIGVFLFRVVRVGGDDDFETVLCGKVAEIHLNGALLRNAMPLHLQIEVVITEDGYVPLKRLAGFLLVFGEQVALNNAAYAGCRRNKSFVIFLQHLPGNVGMPIEMVIGLAGEGKQVAIADVVLGKQDEMVALKLAVKPVGIRLHADDSFLTGLCHLGVELEKAVHVAVVSQGSGIFGRLSHFRDLGHAIQKAVVRVPMQVGETNNTSGVGGVHYHLIALSAECCHLRGRKNSYVATLPAAVRANNLNKTVAFRDNGLLKIDLHLTYLLSIILMIRRNKISYLGL